MAAKVIAEIRSYALASGFSVISSPSVSNDNEIRHIIIKELSLGFFTADKLCNLEIQPTKTVSLRRFYSVDILAAHKARLAFSSKAAKELLDEAVCALKIAKSVHDDLEKCYIDAMDYGKISEIGKSLSERIWQSEWWSD